MAFMFFQLRIFLCFYTILPQDSQGFVCPGLIYPPQGFSYARIESNISERASQGYAKMRIKPIYHPSIESMPYKGLIQQATDFWSNVLAVKPFEGRLFLSRACKSNKRFLVTSKVSGEKELYCPGFCSDITQCVDIQVQNEHLDGCKYCNEDGTNCIEDQPAPGTGVDNADMVFHVSAVDTATCLSGPSIAYASFCQLEPVLNRPVFAIINICPRQASTINSNQLLTTIKHEMMHALGFGKALFPFFRDKDGQTLWPKHKNGTPISENAPNVDNKVLTAIDREWHVRGNRIITKRWFLVTESVRREAKAHFGCSNLEGAELEDFGAEGTRKNHFESRIFYDDAMKGNGNTGKGLFSRIDFAVLEDSGWYQVDYSQAEEMEFGRNLGCDFCKKSCKFWMDKKRMEGKCVEPYCDTPDLGYQRGFTCIGPKLLFTGCPITKLGPGDLVKMYAPSYYVPQRYQYFDHIYGVNDYEVHLWGSKDAMVDYCPIPLQNSDLYSRQVVNLKCGLEPNPAWNPNPVASQSPAKTSNPTLKPWNPNPSTTENPTSEKWELNPANIPNPIEEAKDDEDETMKDDCSHLGSSLLWAFLLPLMVMVL